MKKSHFYWILGVLLLFRLFVITHLGFIDDEAYHWSWTRDLDISYFDHPGMVAWIIWPFTKVFGDVEWAVRLPGFLIFTAILGIVYSMAKDLFDEATGRLCVILLFFIPLWGFASLGTMPDVPLGLFWILTAWIFWQSVRQDEKTWSVQKTWLWIGICMGLGMNSKLTCCLLGLGMILFLLVTPRLRWHLLTPWPYFGALITFIMMTPIFWWNAHHQWATFDYQFLSRHQEAHHVDINRWLQFWTYQWLFMSPMVYFLMLTVIGFGLRHWRDDKWRWLVCLPLPALLLFYYQPLMSAYKPHWSGPAYMILLLGAAALYLRGIPGFFKAKSKVITTLALLFLIPIQVIYLPLFTPVIPKVYAAFADAKNWNPTWDVSNEFYGWRELGAHLNDLQMDWKKQTGRDLLVAGQRYEIVAQLTWGTDARAWQLCKDRDHYLYTQSDAENAALIGQDFLVVSNDKYPKDPTESANFESCTKADWPFYRGETLARTFYIYTCRNFLGLK